MIGAAQLMTENQNSQNEREDTWLNFAIGAAIIGFVSAAFGFHWVVSATQPSEMLTRVQILAPAGVSVFAMVTFFTVIWRGLISAKQTKIQGDQIEKVSLQIQAAEENNLAELLQKGAELIGETKKRAHVAAGIAILEAVATAPNGKFSIQAMNLLTDAFIHYFEEDKSRYPLASIVEALEAGSEKQRSSNRIVEIDGTIARKHFSFQYTPIKGTEAVKITGGEHALYFVESLLKSGAKYQFKQAKLYDGVDSAYALHVDLGMFEECTIERVKINGWDSMPSSGSANRFVECDFSGAEINRIEGLRAAELIDCYYVAENPPVHGEIVDWDQLFIKR